MVETISAIIILNPHMWECIDEMLGSFMSSHESLVKTFLMKVSIVQAI